MTGFYMKCNTGLKWVNITNFSSEFANIGKTVVLGVTKPAFTCSNSIMETEECVKSVQI